VDSSADPFAESLRLPALAPGTTARFSVRRGDAQVSGFVVNHGGRHHAYVNRCPHAGTPLDLWPNEFWTEDGQYLICATHGAIFAPDSGVCVEGPCPGARLERVAVGSDGATILIGPVP
jgi:nitrite reductase/ring-hydroxylating ferredoxin subunit